MNDMKLFNHHNNYQNQSRCQGRCLYPGLHHLNLFCFYFYSLAADSFTRTSVDLNP